MGIWKIEENEDFFLQEVPLQRHISHPHKRLQHLSGRYLLKKLFPDFPYELIMIADTRKPFLSNEAYHFSISHCGDFAAAIVSSVNRVGVDIELVKPMIEKISHKFLGESEMKLLYEGESGTDRTALLTICWSAKEAMFKWHGDGGVDFKSDMQLGEQIDFSGDFIRSCFDFSKDQQVRLDVMSKMFGKLVMSYVIS